MDVVSRLVITVGGIGTIAAVSTVAVFLVWVAAPLFLPARSVPQPPAPLTPAAPSPMHLALSEHQTLAWALLDGGQVVALDAATGETIEAAQELVRPRLTAWSASAALGTAALGFEDGTVRFARLGFASRLVDAADLDEPMRSLAISERAACEHRGRRGVLQRLSETQFRFDFFEWAIDDPIAVADSAIRLIDHSESTSGRTFVALTGAGELKIEQVTERTNLLTKKVTRTVREGAIPYDAFPGRGEPMRVLLTGLGDNVLLIWKDGRAERYDARNITAVSLAEQLDLLEGDDAQIEAVEFLIGKATLLVGDSRGNVGAWFRARSADASGSNAERLVRGRLLRGRGSAVTALASSVRSRSVAVGHADGRVRLHQVTSGKLLAEVSAGHGPVRLAALAPKDDGFAALSGATLHRWTLDARHPEATLAALFTPVWYEGYAAPAHVWQSSSGTDDFEAKLGLTPLIFGTLKATVYSLLFGVPLALLAAVYTSEFLHPRAKAAIKPAIEMMASLPSVVLGFLAALVIAPFVENVVPSALTLVAALPATFLAGALAWQLLPQQAVLRLNRWRFLFILALTPIGVLAAWLLGPLVERLLFAGDIRLWLDGQIGSGLGAWMLLLLPPCAILSGVFTSRIVNPWLRPRSRDWSRRRAAVMDFVKFAGAAAAAIGATWLLAFLLTAIGLDPRGSFVGTYVQRNALIVGFIMGFAIIPIIYTIAEDALSTVPEHLRAASLGAGATRWQTAVRIVLPTAMSGLFSAVMIGLGRAVGETMIVLMAAGNTPVMDWNMFNGFRTLSANIAVELPEAVRNSTHYRTLFLAALVLFAMTFLLNTVAEMVRQRFRRRAYQL